MQKTIEERRKDLFEKQEKERKALEEKFNEERILQDAGITGIHSMSRHKKYTSVTLYSKKGENPVEKFAELIEKTREIRVEIVYGSDSCFGHLGAEETFNKGQDFRVKQREVVALIETSSNVGLVYGTIYVRLEGRLFNLSVGMGAQGRMRITHSNERGSLEMRIPDCLKDLGPWAKFGAEGLLKEGNYYFMLGEYELENKLETLKGYANVQPY